MLYVSLQAERMLQLYLNGICMISLIDDVMLLFF